MAWSNWGGFYKNYCNNCKSNVTHNMQSTGSQVLDRCIHCHKETVCCVYVDEVEKYVAPKKKEVKLLSLEEVKEKLKQLEVELSKTEIDENVSITISPVTPVTKAKFEVTIETDWSIPSASGDYLSLVDFKSRLDLATHGYFKVHNPWNNGGNGLYGETETVERSIMDKYIDANKDKIRELIDMCELRRTHNLHLKDKKEKQEKIEYLRKEISSIDKSLRGR